MTNNKTSKQTNNKYSQSENGRYLMGHFNLWHLHSMDSNVRGRYLLHILTNIPTKTTTPFCIHKQIFKSLGLSFFANELLVFCRYINLHNQCEVRVILIKIM